MSKLGPSIVHVNTILIPSPIREKRIQSDAWLRENYHSASFLAGREWHKMNLWTISGNWNSANLTSKRKWNNYLSFWEIGNIKWWSRNRNLIFSVDLNGFVHFICYRHPCKLCCDRRHPCSSSIFPAAMARLLLVPQPWRTRPHEAWDETELD